MTVDPHQPMTRRRGCSDNSGDTCAFLLKRLVAPICWMQVVPPGGDGATALCCASSQASRARPL